MLLQDFVRYGIAPTGWSDGVVALKHPFVGVSPDGRLVLNLPAHYSLPDELTD
jgi:hypothetical protein